MKNSSVFLLLLFLTVYEAEASTPYDDNMSQAKSTSDTATVEKSWVMAANHFSRISAMNPEKWLPNYYAAYCYARISYLKLPENVRDAWLDKAQAEVDKAFALEPQNAEVLVMKGFVLLSRMNIDPMTRGFKYNEETMGYFKKAAAIDPENPRAYLWQGVNVLNTPEMFGGGKEAACPVIRKSVEKFESYTPADNLAPNWGYGYAKEMLNNCQ